MPKSGNPSLVRLTAFEERFDVSLLADDGYLHGRVVGRKVHEAIARQLQQMPRGSVLLVDLARLRQANYSALREMFSVVDVLRTARFAEKYLVFCADTRNHDLIESIEITVKDRGSMIPLIDRKGEWHNFGRLTKAERDTLEAVQRYEALTSIELCEHLDLLTSAASNRLRRLHHLRLIKREEQVKPGRGGREFIYQPLFSKKRGKRKAARRSGARR